MLVAWLFEVEDIFNLSGLGLVVLGHLKPDIVLRVGEPLIFLCPDGQEVESHIRSFPMIRHRRSGELIAFEIPRTDEAQHITIGTQVYRPTDE